MNAVSVAEPSVWNQFVSRGTLRKRKYLSPPTRPERSSSQSTGTMHEVPDLLPLGLRVCAIYGSDRVEVLLGPVDVDARVGGAVRTIYRVGALALDLGDGVELAEPEVAVDDRVLVAVERAHGRPGVRLPSMS